jgi:hypothetical protein
MVVPYISFAVADREDCPVVPDRPLDEAAVRCQVHDVVLVDPRRTAQQWSCVHSVGLGLVLQQLHQLVAEHHFGGRRREVLSDGECAAVDLSGASLVLHDVQREMARTPQQAHTRCLEGSLHRDRIGDQEIRGGDCVQ